MKSLGSNGGRRRGVKEPRMVEVVGCSKVGRRSRMRGLGDESLG